MQRLDEMPEAGHGRVVPAFDASAPLDGVDLRQRVLGQQAPLVEDAPAETEPHNGVGHPLPSIVNSQPAEQLLGALEEFPDGVQQQALAKAPGAGQEVVPALIHQPADVVGLVDVVEAFLADQPERLNPDG